MTEPGPSGLIAWIVQRFLNYRLSVLFLIFAAAAGIAAVQITPREEEPQIVVPLADVFVQAPGATAEEVEKLVATPLERLLWQVEGVEYVYSMSRRDMAVVTVRFFVGQDRERSLVKLHNQISMHIDEAPPLVRGWVIKPVEIDDVPIINLTLYSERFDDHELRRMGEEVLARLAELPDISRTAIVGGRQREVRLELFPERLAGFGVSLLDVIRALEGTDAAVTAGAMVRDNHQLTLTSDSFVFTSDELAELVVGVHQQRPVYLRDLGRIIDGPTEPTAYTRLGLSHNYAAATGRSPESYPAVTLALAKKRGTNAVDVAENILERFEELRAAVLPADVNVSVTRNYGQTASHKVDELLKSLFFAILTVVGLLALTLGWREALVVGLAVPLSFALALFMNHLFGFTINRVTLFALILSLGLVVDDPIINVDNIQRHIIAGLRPPRPATLFAVQEVLPPVIMSTLAVIVSFTPMFFITGMMGPYMAPMAVNVPLTVTFSTLCALTVVPWLCYTLIRRHITATDPPSPQGSEDPQREVPKGLVSDFYRALIEPFLNSRSLRWLLLLLVLLLLSGSAALALFRQVPLKMLPFDNKNEFQLVIDLPEGTPLEATDRVVRAFEEYLRTVPEVTDFVAYAGTASPIDFNGLVRHYYLRRSANLADIRVNLVEKDRRRQQSHTILLRLRQDLEEIAGRHGARLKLVEVPPGPPVLATIVAEIYGTPDQEYRDLVRGARHVQTLMAEEPWVTDIDDSTETERLRLDFRLDKEKAALHGVTAQVVTASLRAALSGATPATMHSPGERHPLLIRLILPAEARADAESLAGLPIRGEGGGLVPLGELGIFVEAPEEQPIYHKNLQRVVFVYAEMAGAPPGTAVLDLQQRLRNKPLPEGVRAEWAGEGEWKITLDVFRDLGIAYAAALLGIYILLVIQMNSFFMPLLIMVAIPLTLIGIMPGFWLLNLLFAQPVGGFQNPVFFTATSMIGMIALGGIVIRNSLVLIEFIQDAVREGLPFRDAVIESGIMRLRPILLTAATTALGAWPITLDPIFSGLAWALIFGLGASTFFSLLLVPVAYYALNRRRFGL